MYYIVTLVLRLPLGVTISLCVKRNNFMFLSWKSSTQYRKHQNSFMTSLHVCHLSTNQSHFIFLLGDKTIHQQHNALCIMSYLDPHQTGCSVIHGNLVLVPISQAWLNPLSLSLSEVNNELMGRKNWKNKALGGKT